MKIRVFSKHTCLAISKAIHDSEDKEELLHYLPDGIFDNYFYECEFEFNKFAVKKYGLKWLIPIYFCELIFN